MDEGRRGRGRPGAAAGRSGRKKTTRAGRGSERATPPVRRRRGPLDEAWASASQCSTALPHPERRKRVVRLRAAIRRTGRGSVVRVRRPGTPGTAGAPLQIWSQAVSREALIRTRATTARKKEARRTPKRTPESFAFHGRRRRSTAQPRPRGRGPAAARNAIRVGSARGRPDGWNTYPRPHRSHAPCSQTDVPAGRTSPTRSGVLYWCRRGGTKRRGGRG